MRYYDNGSMYTVSVSRREVEAFKDQWPCSGLPDTWVALQFNKRNGDLVDISPERAARSFEGSAASALSRDAQAYGARRSVGEAPP